MRKIKILSLGILLVITFLLSGCTRYFDYNDLKDNVSKVEIIKLIYREDTSGAELIKELSDEDLAKIKFRTSLGMERPYLGEYGIKIYDTNGNYQIICYSSSFSYDINNIRTSLKRWRCSKEEFDTLLSKYINLSSSS